MRNTLWLATLPILLLSSLCAQDMSAQDISGNWQGTLKDGATELRLIVEISKGETGGWKALLFSLDQASDDIPVDSVALKDSMVTLNIPALGGSYEGKLSADATLITGQWTQGSAAPLDFKRATKETAWDRGHDTSPHTTQFITVDKDVKLEVLDWGGSGRPLVLLTGLGNNAHVFDSFALKLKGSYHVYAITRRGFGASSKPDSGYSADQLGDDVLAVIDALKLTRPVLVGHSIAGEELSSIGSRHPEKVAGLIYLDSAYAYAYYDRTRGDFNVDLADMRRKLDQLRPGMSRDPKQLVGELLATELPTFGRVLKEWQQSLDAMSPAELGAMATPMAGSRQAIMEGLQKYTDIRCPILAIYALPEKSGPTDTTADKVLAQAKALETGIPAARVVRVPNADHYVFKSNESDVLREMNAFLATLPK